MKRKSDTIILNEAVRSRKRPKRTGGNKKGSINASRY